MQIHELNNFTGTLGSGAYLAVDDGNDTGKLSTQQLLAATEARIDNIIAGPAPSAEEIVDARLGDDGVTYPSLGDAIRDQVGDLKSDLKGSIYSLLDFAHLNYFIDSYGNPTYAEGWGYTESYYEILPSTTYYFGGTSVGSGIFFAEYDEDKTFLRCQSVTRSTTSFKTTTHANAKYCRISVYNTRWYSFVMSTSDYIGSYKMDLINDAIDRKVKVVDDKFEAVDKLYAAKIETTFNFGHLNHRIHDVSGEIVYTENYGYTEEYYEVTPSTKYYLFGATTLFVAEYDSSKTYIKSTAVTGNTPNITLTANTHYIRLSVWYTRFNTVVLSTQNWSGGYNVARVNAAIADLKQSELPKVFHVGAGQLYTRLRDGIAAGVSAGNAKVYVHAGTYNLINEFASEIQAASGGTGIALGNNVHVVFYDGAKVTANFDNSEGTYDATTWRWIYDNFQPFYSLSQGNADFTIENLEIEASNTRYCVHDELSGTNTYRHEYKNCKMKYVNNHQDVNYVQCIGGGLGEHGTIIIDGGYYECQTDYGYASVGGDPLNCQQCISYHNGYASGCDSSITIKNVYLADRGYFRFGYYGASTIKSNIYISGCETGLPTLKKGENADAANDNFEVVEWNASKRVPAHWQLTSSYQAVLVND